MQNIPRASIPTLRDLERAPTRRANHTSSSKQRRTRRQYALPKFTFDEDPASPYDAMDKLAPRNSPDRQHGTSSAQKAKCEDTCDLEKGDQRYYSTQMLTPTTPVSPCINATDRARRAQKSLVRQPGNVGPADEEVFCDITSLLRDSRDTLDKEANGERGNAGAWGVGDDEDYDMLEMEVSDDEMEAEYEVVENEFFESEHNGTVRRWYRGFRH